MGGEGSIQHMITTMRNNRNMLRKKNYFKRERTFLSTKREYYKASKGKIDSKNISKEELLQIRKIIIRKRKVENIRVWLILFAIITPILIFVIYTFNQFKKDEVQRIENVKEQYLIEHLNKYRYLIDEGDKWIKERNWNNAIYFFKQAVEIFPSEFEGNYRLALVYSYNCKFENKDCNKGKKLTIRLLKYSPENTDLIKLLDFFENNTVANNGYKK